MQSKLNVLNVMILIWITTGITFFLWRCVSIKTIFADVDLVAIRALKTFLCVKLISVGTLNGANDTLYVVYCWNFGADNTPYDSLATWVISTSEHDKTLSSSIPLNSVTWPHIFFHSIFHKSYETCLDPKVSLWLQFSLRLFFFKSTAFTFHGLNDHIAI